ncbi:MAG: hypothetical protein IKH72_06955 [Firmicutes bacterium]|nr:hypothetical protein [Bacillota bacterium]
MFSLGGAQNDEKVLSSFWDATDKRFSLCAQRIVRSGIHILLEDRQILVQLVRLQIALELIVNLSWVFPTI